MIDVGAQTPKDTVCTLEVNGREFFCSGEKKLMDFLRDDLKLKSVKDGCSQGACGTCTVIVDGLPQKACVLPVKRMAGKKILTVEGLSDFEKEAFVFAFGECGAVQCGFCIPGMVMAGKALIDKNPNPTEQDIKEALKNNICRCTGYKKIIEAITVAAEILRGERQFVPQSDNDIYHVGQKVHRTDVREKVLGYGEYVDDVEIKGMVYSSAVRSAYPRARVISVDTSEALKHSDCIDILTAKDVPNNKVGHITQDWDVFIAEGDITRCVGDAIVLVVSEKETSLDAIKKLVKIEYEELKPVATIAESMAEDAPLLHPKGNICAERHVKRGNADVALSRCKHVVTRHYSTPTTEHAFLEAEAAIGFPYKGGVKVYSSDQGVYDTRHEIAIMFGWDKEKIVVENKLIGGGFGGKEDVSCQHLVALAAVKTGRTVKYKFTRDESIAFHPKRHAMEADFTLGCDENGIFQAMKAEIYMDTGAYASLCGPVLERACTHSVGPYTYQNTEINGYGCYTNNPPAGAFRGFGVCQTCFAIEMNINLLAEMAGISPWEIRYRNAIEPGKVLPNGQIADVSTALKETLLAVKDAYEEHKDRAGIACAMKNSGVGVGLPDKGRAKADVKDGIVRFYSAASDIGQGSITVMIQIASETLKMPPKFIRYMPIESEFAPDSGTTSGSRQTLLTGEAVRAVCQQIRDELDAGRTLADLEDREFSYEYFEPTDPINSAKPNPKSHIAYGFATHLVVIGDGGRVSDVYAAHDSGKVINPTSIQGQIEGGVVMSLGYAFTEDLKLQNCVPKAKFGTLGLWRSTDIPNVHAIYVEKENLLDVAYGAKGIGEIASIPTAPAAAGAYYKYDGVFRQTLPLANTAYSKNKK